MKLPESLIQSFITSEFPECRRTSSGEYCVNSFYIEDTKRKLYINASTGVFICFKSGQTGSFITLVKDYIGANSYKEAFEYLVKNYSFKLAEEEVPKDLSEEEEQNKKVLIDFMVNDRPIFFTEPDKLGIFGKKAYSYLLSRKLDEEYYPKLGYVYNSNSRYNERVIIPFYENKKIVYFAARAVDKNNKLRYLMPPKLDSKQFVFNIDKINDEVIIAEGTMDAMSITSDQAATCLMSADIGKVQMEKIFARKPNTIIYVPDQDETGLNHMEKNIKKLITYCPYQGLNIYIYTVPEGCKDLNDMKIKTGKNYILKKECEKYGTNIFSRSKFA